MRLRGKTIVIIGATGGIGLAAAKACIEDGASVVGVGRDEKRAEEARTLLGDAAFILTGDATEPQTAPKAISQAISRYGGFDGMFHVAGGSGRSRGDGTVHTITDDGWEYTLRLNLTSLFYSNRAAIGSLLERKTSGSILNCSSVLAYSPSPKHFASHAYAAAKSAIVGLTISLASHYAPDQIRCNCVAPGLIATNMSRRAQESDEIMDLIHSKQPLDGGRIGEPEDLAGAVVWLMSDESRFVTGQTIAIDGGWSVS